MIGSRFFWSSFCQWAAAAEAIRGARAGWIGLARRARALLIHRLNGDAGGENGTWAHRAARWGAFVAAHRSVGFSPRTNQLHRMLRVAMVRPAVSVAPLMGILVEKFRQSCEPIRAPNRPPFGDLSATRQDQAASQPAPVATSTANSFRKTPYIQAATRHRSRDDFKLPPPKALSRHEKQLKRRRQLFPRGNYDLERQNQVDVFRSLPL